MSSKRTSSKRTLSKRTLSKRTLSKTSSDRSTETTDAILSVIGIGFMILSVYLFFKRNPKGCRPQTRYFRVGEFLVALFFPVFYILYFIVSDPSPIIKEGYADEDHRTSEILISFVFSIISIWSIVLWAYRTSYTTGWKWGHTNFLGFLGAVIFPIIYIPYTYADPIVGYTKASNRSSSRETQSSS